MRNQAKANIRNAIHNREFTETGILKTKHQNIGEGHAMHVTYTKCAMFTETD